MIWNANRVPYFDELWHKRQANLNGIFTRIKTKCYLFYFKKKCIIKIKTLGCNDCHYQNQAYLFNYFRMLFLQFDVFYCLSSDFVLFLSYLSVHDVLLIHSWNSKSTWFICCRRCLTMLYILSLHSVQEGNAISFVIEKDGVLSLSIIFILD